MDDFAATIKGFREQNVKITADNLHFYNSLSTLSNRMAALEQHAPAIELYSTDRPHFYQMLKDLSTEMVKVTHAHDQIAQLVSRVAALERPWYKPFTTTKPRASDPARSTPPATNMTALLLRMDEFNS